MRKKLPLLLIISLISCTLLAQQVNLADTLKKIASAAGGEVGIAARYEGRSKPISINGSHHFPMQSVFKFPLAMAILHQVDNGQLSLDSMIHIDGTSWRSGTWSPMRDHYHSAAADVTVREILRYTVSESDNNGCDLLFKLAGGPRAVNDYIHQLGIKAIAITATEADMARNWDVQYQNWCTPDAIAQLLQILLSDQALKPASNTFLMNLLTATATGPKRIKGLLPAGTKVAHKTGTSDTNEKGVTAATNDVGIITLASGKQVILAVFIRDSPADETTREATIARIARTVFAVFSKQ
jgi:beta-lactamase class A